MNSSIIYKKQSQDKDVLYHKFRAIRNKYKNCNLTSNSHSLVLILLMKNKFLIWRTFWYPPKKINQNNFLNMNLMGQLINKSENMYTYLKKIKDSLYCTKSNEYLFILTKFVY